MGLATLACRALTKQFKLCLQAGTSRLLDDCPYLVSDAIQGSDVCGAQIKQGGCTRGDGVDAGTPFDDADIVGGFRLPRNLQVSDGGDDASQPVDRSWRSECSIRMSAWTTHYDAPAFRADGNMDDSAKISIDGDNCTQFLAVAFDSGTCAEEIAQAFLAHVGNRDNIGTGLFL